MSAIEDAIVDSWVSIEPSSHIANTLLSMPLKSFGLFKQAKLYQDFHAEYSLKVIKSKYLNTT